MEVFFALQPSLSVASTSSGVTSKQADKERERSYIDEEIDVDEDDGGNGAVNDEAGLLNGEEDVC